MTHSSPSSENDFLRLIDAHFTNSHPHMSIGRGDDCAHLKTPADTVLTTDIFLEDVHFRRSYFSPADIGHKALAVNISDIAGMGCTPLGFSLGLIIPASEGGLDGNFWDDMFAGMAALAKAYDIPLTGGDLSKGPCLGFSVTIWGTPQKTGRILTRGTANAGDVIFTCGNFGLARTGLFALEAKGTAAAPHYPDAVKAHLRPMPRVSEGVALAADEGVTSLMDLSDGLARDLPRLTGNGLGAALTIREDSLPEDIIAYCLAHDEDALSFAVLGGEDYALLGTCSPDTLPRIEASAGARAIGRATEDGGITINGISFSTQGFDHFAKHA